MHLKKNYYLTLLSHIQIAILLSYNTVTPSQIQLILTEMSTDSRKSLFQDVFTSLHLHLVI